MKHLSVCNAEPPQDKEHQEEGKGAHGKGIVLAVFILLEKHCGQHGICRSDAANEQAGDNAENGTKIPMLRAPECYENIWKGHRKYIDMLIEIPEIQEKQSKQIGTNNQHHRSDPPGTSYGDWFAEVNQEHYKAAQKGL